VENSKIKLEKDAIKALIALVEFLRGEHGCPWDKKQTPKTMLIYLIEEMYELVDAIESDRVEEVREELGDVLFHIVFITRLFQETGDFSIYDVARDITEKMIRRHPHVFGTARLKNTDEIRQNWHQIKQNEKKHARKESVLDSVPVKLPALMRAYRIGERTERYGFKGEDRQHLLDRLNSEFEQLKQSIEHTQKDRIEYNFGSLLFSLVNLARLLTIHPETALSGAVKAFEKRFRQMEKGVSGK
jgi:tetrapyrrole methylase family protein/MazG family protein